MRWFVTSLISTLAACGCSHTITVTSRPQGASVYFLNSNGAREGLAGQTPLHLERTKSTDGFYFLEVEKPGYIPQSLFVANAFEMGSSTNVAVNLRKQSEDWFNNLMKGAFASQTNQFVADFVELHAQVIGGDDVDVKRAIDKLKPKYDNLAIFHSVVGAYYWSKKDLAKARASYEKALSLDPNNSDAKQMLNLLGKNR